MNFEKYVDGKVYYIFDKIYNLIVINLILMIVSVLGFGVLTLFPALAATYILVQSIREGKNISLIKGFWKIMKKDYFKLQKMFIIMVLIVGIFAFNTLFFYNYAISDGGTFFHLVGLFIILSLDMLVIGMLIHIFPVYMYFDKLKPVGIIKFSALMVFAFPLKTLIIAIVSFGWILLISLQPPTIPFISVTIPVYINLKLFDGIYKKMTDNYSPIAQNYFD